MKLFAELKFLRRPTPVRFALALGPPLRYGEGCGLRSRRSGLLEILPAAGSFICSLGREFLFLVKRVR